MKSYIHLCVYALYTVYGHSVSHVSRLVTDIVSLQLCVSKLRLFIEDPDQNLKYLGLLAMAKILKAQPKIVQQHK